MLKSIVQKVASRPWVYDQIQYLAGMGFVDRRIERQLGRLGRASSVLDLGGGTGRLRTLFLSTCTYICLDHDLSKLRKFHRSHQSGLALVADVTRTPTLNHSIDVILVVAVSHHLTDSSLSNLMKESRRVLKAEGKIVFMDALWNPRRMLGRLLWRYDRGSFPRSEYVLRSTLASHFEQIHEERFTYLHEYLLWVGAPGQGEWKVDTAYRAPARQPVSTDPVTPS
jgi:SAM-dependent methyltransferase